MRRVDNRTVILTEEENQISELFEQHLDDGHSIEKAVSLCEEEWSGMSPEFVEWLRN